MTTITRSSAFLVGVLMLSALAPLSAFASSSPSCSLTITTPRGTTEFSKKADVLVEQGEKVTIAWQSKNAKTAFFNAKSSIGLTGSTTIQASTTATYTYRFNNGSKKVECTAVFKLVAAGVDSASLITTASKPTISGTATGTKAVSLLVTKDGRKFSTASTIKVRNGTWKTTLSKSLADGTYGLSVLGDKKAKLNVIATTTLTVLPKGSSTTAGSLSASSIALLTGGTASAGASIPIAYIQLVNTSNATTSISGFRLAENGSAPDDVVIGFATNDDKGGSRTVIGGTSPQFKNGTALVPLQAVLAPHQLRIFTIKALLAASSGNHFGSQLKIDLAGVDSTATVTGTFPIRGTTWTLSF